MQVDVDQPEEGVAAHVAASLKDQWRLAGVALLGVSALLILFAVAQRHVGGIGSRGVVVAAGVGVVLAMFVLAMRGAAIHRRKGGAATPLRTGGDWLPASAGKSPVPGIRGGVEARVDGTGVHLLRRSTYAWDVVIGFGVVVVGSAATFAADSEIVSPLLLGAWSLNVYSGFGLPRVQWTRVIVGWEEIRSVEIDAHRFRLDCDEGAIELEARYSARRRLTDRLREHGGAKVRTADAPPPRHPPKPPPRPTLGEASARLDALRREPPRS